MNARKHRSPAPGWWRRAPGRATADRSVMAAAVVPAVAAAARTGVAAVAVIVAAVAVVAMVVVVVVVLVTQPVVVLEGVDRVAQVVLDGGSVRRVARVEQGAVLHEPLAGVDVEGDVRGLVGHHEASLELLLGLDGGGEGELLAVEGALDDGGGALLEEIVRAGDGGRALQRVDLELDLVVGAGRDGRVEHAVHLPIQIVAGEVDHYRAQGDLGAAIAVPAAQLDLFQRDSDARQGDPRGGRSGLACRGRVPRAEREGRSGASAACSEQDGGGEQTETHRQPPSGVVRSPIPPRTLRPRDNFVLRGRDDLMAGRATRALVP